MDPLNRLYYVSDRVGLDVPIFNTVSNIALWAIGGDNSIAEAGFNASSCWVDASTGETIPPITTAQGNFTRFGCKTNGFRLPGFFGPNGHSGGFPGGQCCASRSNNLNPLSGPNGLEVSVDGNFAFVGNGSSNVVVFDLVPTISSGFTAPPTALATIVTGTSPDYDGIPNGITGCMQSANGRAFSDPTCGDLRGDELATTGSLVTFPQDGSSRYLLAVINGDPGLPFVSIVDVTGIVTTIFEPPGRTLSALRAIHDRRHTGAIQSGRPDVDISCELLLVHSWPNLLRRCGSKRRHRVD